MQNGRSSNGGYKRTLWENIVLNKISAPVVIIFLLLTAICISYLVAKGGLVAGVIILGAVIALPIAYAIVIYPQFGIITLITLSFFINYIGRFLPETAPEGLAIDAITYLLILGFFVRQKKEKDWQRFDNAITYFTLLWIAYNIFEIVNPNSPAILEWVFTVRTVGVILLMYFVFLLHIRTKEFIKLLFKLWLAFTLVSGLVGFQQEHWGLFPFEQEWLHRLPGRYKLLFISGHLRKWGIFSDPVVYAYNMAAAILLCISLMLGDIKPGRKLLLGLMAAFFLMVMLYSGTRASYVILLAGLVMLSILNLNRKVVIFFIAGGIIIGALIFVPTTNPTLARFQTAFSPSQDASFNERTSNQERIKPYILTHPIGGGLGAVGVWGQRFAPNSYLAKFPPDSGFVRVAVETGWIGLFIFCTFNFVVLYKGIQYYFRIKDPELKLYCAAMLVIIFMFDVGNYPQQAIVQYPSNILYYLAMAILNVTMILDNEEITAGKLKGNKSKLEFRYK